MITQKIGFLLVCMALMACDSDNDSSPAITKEFQGQLKQLRTFGGSQQDDFLDVTFTSDNGIAAFGFTQSTDGDLSNKVSADSDYWLVKFDENLELIWQKTYGGSDDDRGQAITATADGGFIVTGFSRSNDGDVSQNNGFQDMWTLKLNASGNIEWETSIGYQGNDRAYDVIQTQDGGYFVTGFLDVTASNGQGNDDFQEKPTANAIQKHGVGEYWGIKLDAQGNIQWRRYYGGSNNDRSYAVIQLNSGEFVQTGHSESDDFDITNPLGTYDAWFVKTGNNKELMWQKNIGGSSIDIAYDLIETQDFNILATGNTRSTNQDISNSFGNADAMLTLLSPTGNLIWNKNFGGSSFDTTQKIKALPNGNYMAVGHTRSSDMNLSNNNGQNDIWVFSVTPDGNLSKSTTIGGSGLDFGNSLTATPTQVFVVGSSESNDFDISQNKGDKDAIIIKLE